MPSISLGSADAFYDPRRPDPDTPTEFPNLAPTTTGPATNVDLDVLTGPAFWFPGLTDHELVCIGFAIPSTIGPLALPYTNGALTIKPADVDDVAEIFTASTGQDVVIGQGTPARITEDDDFRITEDGNPRVGE